MAGLLGKLLGSTGGLAKAVTGGAGSRAVLGGIVGGIAGGIGSMNSNDPNQRAAGIMKGAVAGAFLGASSRLVTPAIRWGKEGAMTTGMPVGLSMLKKMTGFGASVGASAGKFAFRNPRLAMGMTAVGALGLGGMYAASNILGDEGTSLNADYNDWQYKANRIQEDNAYSRLTPGVSPMNMMSTGTTIRAGRMHQSTFGLVQGLGRGRHALG